MKKNFYVCDSYHTGAIAEKIKQTFPESTVYTDSTIVSICKESALMTAANFLQKSTSEKTIEKSTVTGKVDFFVLSAKLISDGSINPAKLKAEYGHEGSKSIAVSMSFHFLNIAKKDVDFAEDKENFFDKIKIKTFFSKL